MAPKRARLAGVAAALAALMLLAAAPQTSPEESSADVRLRTLMDQAWELRLIEDPLFATQAGDLRYNDRLPAVSLADYERRRTERERLLAALDEIPREELHNDALTDYRIFRRLLHDELAELEFKSHLMPITGRTGFHVALPQLSDRVPLETVQDFEDYIARIAAVQRYVEQNIELMRQGIREGFVPPRQVLGGWQRAVGDQIVGDPEDSLMFAPFRSLPGHLEAQDRARLAELARNAIRESLLPAYRSLRRFLEQEYVPATREGIAASGLPRGEAFYRHRVRRFTTLDTTPEEVHRNGLAEVRRIREQMHGVMDEVGWEGTFRDFLAFLRNDPRFYVDRPEELLEQTALVLKRIDGELPRLFGRLPRMPYGIRSVPDFIAPRATTAYYERPAGDGSRAGFYYVNTHELDSRPLYAIEALSLHEAVPGHHLQIALQQELEHLHPLRRFAGFTVFVEGWALYAERLGLEVGFYQDPYSDFGRLSYEMWRACRLVVDTGMHALGWTRQRAIDFMAENSALSIHNIITEVDRYISWPGQALAYKTGEMKIGKLRAYAERELGSRFDLRRFHDAVLAGGAVPLDVLEDNVDDYVSRVRAEPPKARRSAKQAPRFVTFQAKHRY